MSADQIRATRTFKCSRPACGGQVIVAHEMSVPLRTSCHFHTPAFPCVECGLLYFGEGQPAENRSGWSPYLDDKGDKPVIVLRDGEGVEQSRHAIGM